MTAITQCTTAFIWFSSSRMNSQFECKPLALIQTKIIIHCVIGHKYTYPLIADEKIKYFAENCSIKHFFFLYVEYRIMTDNWWSLMVGMTLSNADSNIVCVYFS